MYGPDLDLLKKSLFEVGVTSLFLERAIDKVLVELVDYLNPVRQNLDRKPGSGLGYEVYRRTPGVTQFTTLGTGSSSGMDATLDVIDTDTAAESTGTYSELFLAYKTLLTRGIVGRRIQKTGRTIADLLQEEMEAKAREIKDAEEQRIFWGTNPLPSTKQFPGINSYVATNTGQIVALTNSSVGVPMTLALLDQVIDINIGHPSMLVTSRAGRRKLNALLQAQQRFLDKVEIKGGFRVLSYDDIPVVASINIPETLQITTGGTVSAFTGGSTTVLYVLDLQDVFMSVLTEVTALPLARTSSQFEQFDIFMDETLVVRDFRHVSAMTGIQARS